MSTRGLSYVGRVGEMPSCLRRPVGMPEGHNKVDGVRDGTRTVRTRSEGCGDVRVWVLRKMRLSLQ